MNNCRSDATQGVPTMPAAHVSHGHSGSTTKGTSVIGTTNRITHHCRARMRQYRISQSDLVHAIGAGWTSDKGLLTCRLATDGPVRVGDPLIIGRGFKNGKPSVTLLIATASGRLLHCAGVLEAERLFVVITVWDPNDPINRGLWRDDLLVPTVAGAQSLPPQRWIVGAPNARRSYAPLHVNRTRKDHS